MRADRGTDRAHFLWEAIMCSRKGETVSRAKAVRQIDRQAALLSVRFVRPGKST
jgi:hypothetical protein